MTKKTSKHIYRTAPPKNDRQKREQAKFDKKNYDPTLFAPNGRIDPTQLAIETGMLLVALRGLSS